MTDRVRWFLEAPGKNVDSYVAVEFGSDGPTLKIADCTRSVELSFEFGKYDNRTKGQARRKLAKLQRALAMIEKRLI